MTSPPPARVRHPWIDNLRVVVIVGVIAAHVSLIYAIDVGWYYEERTVGTVTEVLLAALFSPGLLFGMGLLFLVAGTSTPSAIARKGPRRFVVDRAVRLGVPSVLYLLAVNPAMDWLGDVEARQAPSDYLRDTYLDDVAFGIAWFIATLLVFSVAFAAWRSRHPARPQDRGPLTAGVLVRAGAAMAAAYFVVRLAFPFLATDRVLGLNLFEWPQMAVLFVLGALARERGWLADGLTPELRRSCGRAAVAGAVAAALLGGAIASTDDPDPFLGGPGPQALAIPLIEALISLGTSFWLVDWFRRRWDRGGPFVEVLGRASFGAYLVHAPITVVLALLLRDVGVAAEVKAAVVSTVTVAAAFGLGWLASRSRRATRIL